MLCLSLDQPISQDEDFTLCFQELLSTSDEYLFEEMEKEINCREIRETISF